MGLQRFIKQESEVLGHRIVFMLVLSSLATGLLVSVINHAAGGLLTHAVEGRLLLLYLLVFLLYIYTLKYSLAHTVYPLGRALYRLRLRLVDKAGACGLGEFERIDGSEVQARLSHEIDLAAQILPWITYSSQAVTIVLFSLIYLAWLSFAAFLIVFLTIAGAALWHVFVEKQMHHEFRNIGVKELQSAKLLETLSDSSVELRLNPSKRAHFLSAFSALSEGGESLKNLVDRQTISSIMSTRIALFVLLAVFVFIIPVYDPEATHLIFKITVITFFIMGPISQLVYALPLLLRLDGALSALYAFEARLDAAGQPQAGEGEAQAFSPEFYEIRLASASFSYPGGKPDPFDRLRASPLDKLKASPPPLFGDLNLSLGQGSLVLIHGPAGCGKTTLLKLLCGLYAPTTGSVYVSKRRVRGADYPPYRALFACALRDVPPPAGLHPVLPAHDERVPTLLARFGLQDQVEYRNGRFIHAPLSSSQRWRLSLAATLAQDRPLYLFDGGPDAELECWFYQEMLEELRGKDKTVVAVVSDSRWFPLADRIWRIQPGGEVNLFLPTTDESDAAA